MDRRTFLMGAMALPASHMAGGGHAVSDPIIDAATIDNINTATDGLRIRDARHGGTHYRDAVSGASWVIARPKHSLCPQGLQPALDAAIAWRCSVVGFMAFDLGRHNDAGHYLRTADKHARRAGNWSLLARVLGQHARMFIYQGRPSPALAMLDEAITGGRTHLSMTEMAMLHALQARGLATAQRKDEADAAAKTANGFMFGGAEPSDAIMRPWISHYNEAHHWGDIASAYSELTRQGHRFAASASGAYGNAVGCAEYRGRATVLHQLGLARIEVEAGQLDHGIEAAYSALTVAPSVQSCRVEDNLLTLAESLSKHPTHPEAVDLRVAIRDTLATAQH